MSLLLIFKWINKYKSVLCIFWVKSVGVSHTNELSGALSNCFEM